MTLVLDFEKKSDLLTSMATTRPVSFTKSEGERLSVVECGYDSMGRRYMKKATTNGTVTLNHRYLYQGHLPNRLLRPDARHPPVPVDDLTWDPPRKRWPCGHCTSGRTARGTATRP